MLNLDIGLNAMNKQKLVVKFLKATIWDKKLSGFIVTFEKRRDDLEFAMQMSATVTVSQTQTEYVKLFLRVFSFLMIDISAFRCE
jgi:hypothetical protein